MCNITPSLPVDDQLPAKACKAMTGMGKGQNRVGRWCGEDRESCIYPVVMPSAGSYPPFLQPPAPFPSSDVCLWNCQHKSMETHLELGGLQGDKKIHTFLTQLETIKRKKKLSPLPLPLLDSMHPFLAWLYQQGGGGEDWAAIDIQNNITFEVNHVLILSEDPLKSLKDCLSSE